METSLAAIHYYAREGFWHTMQETCSEELRNGADPMLVFWSAFSMYKEGDITKAIREMEQIINRSEVMLPAFIALKKFHNACRLVDQEAVDKITFRLTEMKNNAPEIAYVLCAQYYHLLGNESKATQYADIALRKNEHNLQALCVKSWCNIKSEQSARSFDYILESSGDSQFTRFPDAVMGKVKFLEQKKKFPEIIEILNELVVMNPKFTPALIEKAKVQMMVGDWDQSLETAQRMLASDPYNIEGLRIQIFHLLAREANAEMACEKLNDIGKALAKKEPRNAILYINITMPIARICGRKENVLKKCLALTQQARKLDPDNSAVISEVGHQLMLLADYNGAITTFTEASQKDEGNVEPLYKIVHCRILQDQLQDAEGQMEFLSEIESSTGKTATLVFLQALLAWRQSQNKRESLRYLDESLSLHVGASKQLMPGYDFYTKLNPDFLLEMAKEYLQHVGLSPLPMAVKPPSHLVRGTKLLETITKQIPGIIEAQLLLAKAKFVSNEHQAAQRYIGICLQMDPNFVDALLLSAMINYHNEQYMGAAAALEQAISHNFRIRDNPLFMLVKGQVELKNNQPREALKTLEAAFNLPGVTSPGDAKKSGLFLSFSQEDKASLYIALALAYAENGKLTEASGKIMEAIGEFTGTSEEVKVLIANSELSLRKGDIKQALDMLKTVQAESPHYKAARIAMADIYLKHTGDRRLYAKCFSDIVEAEKTVPNYLLLGEAFMKIQEPEEAIRVYQMALEQKPNDLFLTREIGRALVLTHDYDTAIKYYRDSIATNQQNTSLMTDLARLYLRLNRFGDAHRILDDALRVNMTDVDSLRASVQNYLLRAKVLIASKRGEDPLDLQPMPDALKALQAAKACQKDLISRARDMSHDQVNSEKELYSQIMFQIGEYYETRDRAADSQENAFNAYHESLIYNDLNEKCIVTLAKFHMKRGELDQCMKQCNSLLQQNSSHEFASSMMCEILLQQHKTDEAIQHYQKLLSADPDNYRGLARLILLLRRAGKLKDAEQYITKAEKARKSSGLSYCKGLYHRYTGNPQDSLTHFNAARTDAEYAESALKCMIEIYLNPDNEPMWMERPASQDNIRAAEVLLGELNSKGQTPRGAMYACMSLISTNTRQSIVEAGEIATDILNQNPNYVPATIMIAASKIAENIPSAASDAKAQLQNLSQYPYQPNYADDFEKGWLMLAELCIQSDNFDQASDLLGQCLRYNASCGKAEELIGLIKEKENEYEESSQHYEAAWRLSNKASASIGFRLALNYLKAGKLVDCIQICAAVLKLYPDYPNIREQIMQRAQEALRP